MPPLRQDRPAILLHGDNNGCKNKNPLDGIAREREKKADGAEVLPLLCPPPY